MLTSPWVEFLVTLPLQTRRLGHAVGKSWGSKLPAGMLLSGYETTINLPPEAVELQEVPCAGHGELVSEHPLTLKT